MSVVVAEVERMLREASLQFARKPILIGGKAMEHYGIRKAGQDIDLVITDEDYQRLEREHPQARKDIYGDLGVVLWPFEIWRSIALLDYGFYLEGAQELDTLCVVSLERLLFTRVIAREVEKYANDLDLMVAFYYDRFRNKGYLETAEGHVASYEKHGGVILSGKYEA